MKVIFIDSVHPILFKELEYLGFKCDELSHLSHQEIKALLPQYDGAVIRSKFLFDKVTLDLASNLKWIARSGAGMENINISYAESKGIKCFNSPEGNRDAVAEQAIGMLLMLFNNLKTADTEVRSGIWEREGNRGLEIKGKTVGIIGFGVMGEAFAQRLKGFNCKVIAYDKYNPNFEVDGVESVSMKELQAQSDIVSLHFNYLPENLHFFNKEVIDGFKKDIYVINTSRGKNLSIKDISIAIKLGKIKGACLDVLEFEASSFESLDFFSLPEEMKFILESDQVILSPHIAGWTKESYFKLSSFLAQKIKQNFF